MYVCAAQICGGAAQPHPRHSTCMQHQRLSRGGDRAMRYRPSSGGCGPAPSARGPAVHPVADHVCIYHAPYMAGGKTMASSHFGIWIRRAVSCRLQVSKCYDAFNSNCRVGFMAQGVYYVSNTSLSDQKKQNKNKRQAARSYLGSHMLKVNF